MGSVGAPVADRFPFGWITIVGIAFSGLLWIGAVLVAGPIATVVLFTASRIPGGVYNVSVVTIFQTSVSDDRLGRVWSTVASATSLAVPSGLLLGGVAGEWIGSRLVMFAGGVGSLLMAAYWFLIPPLPDLDHRSKSYLVSLVIHTWRTECSYSLMVNFIGMLLHNMNLRSATVADIPRIQTIAERSWERNYDVLTRETARETAMEWYNEEKLRTDIERDDARIQVAEADESGIIGFSHSVWGDEETVTGTVLRLYVDPNHRNRGVGSKLLEATRAVLKEHNLEWVEAMVLAANEPGNDFYRSAGFKRIEVAETTIGDDSYSEYVYRDKTE
ncbi:GNAT family N-acetyltransferase [Halocatena marina]|uniref:GNAT family N-acetyltransferase n=1 Tax=Halocatena marina TaxID=2934937 RepID=A0ABD5YQF2_9EURY